MSNTTTPTTDRKVGHALAAAYTERQRLNVYAERSNDLARRMNRNEIDRLETILELMDLAAAARAVGATDAEVTKATGWSPALVDAYLEHRADYADKLGMRQLSEAAAVANDRYNAEEGR